MKQCKQPICNHFLINVLLIQLLEPPDWAFLREKQSQIAFLFGDDDHWGPLQMSEEVSQAVSFFMFYKIDIT